jgi:hypothetical protein
VLVGRVAGHQPVGVGGEQSTQTFMGAVVDQMRRNEIPANGQPLLS